MAMTVKIPSEFVDQKVEILIFPVEWQEEISVQALSDYSASTIEEWQHSDEDFVWT